uniref:Uncharacterized protein n=1 Tax=Cucumis sativus TaxID=3659 RepID=A0A0A0LSG8_CUCSA
MNIFFGVEIDTKLPLLGDKKWVMWISSFNVLVGPGKIRFIVCTARNFFQFSMAGPVVPRWHKHWTWNKKLAESAWKGPKPNSSELAATSACHQQFYLELRY